MGFKKNKITCSRCGYEIIMDITDEKYQELHKIYEELYEYKINKADLNKEKQELLLSINFCHHCGSIFREFICESKHICTTFKFCSICGKDTTMSC